MTTNMRSTKSDAEIHEAVRAAYSERGEDSGCCGASDVAAAAHKMGYSRDDVDAAREVGPSGRVIDVDMTPEMIERSRANADRGDIENVEFRAGQIEALPIEDESIDVIISNCVINLSPDKPAVFREAFRVLKPGGRLAVSDILLTKPLPEAVADNLAAYAGCLAGASLVQDYTDAIRSAGFDELEIETRPATEVLANDDPVVRSATDALASCCGEGPGVEGVTSSIVSATATARKH